MDIKIKELKEVPLSKLTIAEGQVRTSGVTTDIIELAGNIAKIGLIHPIKVRETELAGFEYEVIAGQRRFLAHIELKKSTIMCEVLDESDGRLTLEEIKMISFSENNVRLDLSNKDSIDACTALYYKYGSVQMVADELGLPYSRIQNYVKFIGLTDDLKDMVTSNQITLKTAVNAQNAANQVGGDEVKENAVTFAKELSTMASASQKKLTQDVVNKVSGGTQSPIESIIEESKAGSKIVTVTVGLGPDLLGRLDTFATEEGTNRDGAAVELISDSLNAKGY